MPDLTMTMLFARDLTGLGVELPASAQLALDVHDRRSPPPPPTPARTWKPPSPTAP